MTGPYGGRRFLPLGEPTSMPSRRRFLGWAVGVPAGLALSACSRQPSVDSSDGGDRRPIRAVWWGNEVRTTATRKAFAAFTSATSVAVQSEPADWGGYWDRLATQLAAKTAPDLVQMDEKYLLEYADRSALLDLTGKVNLGDSPRAPRTWAL